MFSSKKNNSNNSNTTSLNDQNKFRTTNAYAEAKKQFLEEQALRQEKEAKLKRAIGQKSKSKFLDNIFAKKDKKVTSNKGEKEDYKLEYKLALSPDDLHFSTMNNKHSDMDYYFDEIKEKTSRDEFGDNYSVNNSANASPIDSKLYENNKNSEYFTGDTSKNDNLDLYEDLSSGSYINQSKDSNDNSKINDSYYQEDFKDAFKREREWNIRDKAIKNERNNAVLRTQLNKETAEKLASIHKRQSRIQTGTMILFVLSAILLTLIIVQSFAKNTRPTPNLIIVQEGRMSDYYDTYGLVARDETIIKSETEGAFEPVVAEGTRVSIDNLIGRIVSDESKDDLISQIRSLNRQISLEIVSLLNDQNFPEAIRYYSDADASIYPDIKLIQQAAMKNSVADLLETNNSIRNAMSTRNRQLDSLNFNDPVIRDLRAEKENYEYQLNEKSVEIVSKQSGFVSFRMSDNGEKLLSPQQLEKVSFDEIKVLMSEYRGSHRTVGTVTEDTPIVRVATGGTQYFLLQVDGARTKDFPMEKLLTLEVRAESAPIDSIKILKVSPNSRGVLLLCSTQSQVERLLGRNVIEGKILMNSDRGLVVPSSSLMFEDKEVRGTADIYIVRSGYVHKETVRVRLEDADQALIEPIDTSQTLLASGSIVVSNPNTVKEGQTLE